jgi:GNAT superfamily N-acetyltransferase
VAAVEVEVRPRVESDLDALVALLERVHRLDGYPPRRPADLGRFVAAPGAWAAWVAVVDGAVVGHVCLNRTSSAPVIEVATAALAMPADRLGVVARLFVAPEHRRAGVAGRLLDAATAGARQRGVVPILDVAVALTGAVALYERRGWRRLGQATVSIGGDAPPLDELVLVAPDP